MNDLLNVLECGCVEHRFQDRVVEKLLCKYHLEVEDTEVWMNLF